ncbi:bifunctional diaminohydroxyphosphoribosylaminopyrimidine deaminase/5-amino-6-(5-phosphoribosylamino)uracil reductase RibD [Wielerella bovis]|uniref:bifunctional diaminohydroxyphosphoribosylaminopyrimidine deaminase/5-amino-6-(5-phosphoribosylamino)uracil reductase RibD n=1 Tax=Wielerella bovis TaxID=2917790 RepID=UPI0020191E1C|nr:bifunctional diaminohydroxyphosphoribosylaminopyrimidine deaminase/5-amino-6-(5-phosphoribosylamino)uracil reductase RibD [Wielerella bovis]ULJ64582.1 bifunctional diaminohydroxyphosphoribosylaminopyrimidine deaminase/5-amino-6-(5-phosphoribosylamino)uracil reductase RibD [Wielerella bovis]ULJ66871.1 bifunctional diaminohydroxyphosphoribosylaminopyrimidine deaminase/5-amino-6-(5-phosphoribosylamino)uracil reductase RibD [Wielerella bovis]
MIFSTQDEQYMRRTLDLAWQGRFSTSPNPRVGCVIAQGEQIVGVGFHVRAGEPHAEVHALRQAGELARGATAYVTLEPCSHYGRTPPCAKGLIEAGVARVVAAMQDPNPLVAGKGLAMLAQAGITVQYGLLADEARALNRGFLSRIERQRPFVRVKIAASLDSKTALADGRSFWITGAAARHDVQILRAESCAILTGIGTILADNPRLNVREIATIRQPIRIVLDTHFRLPESANVIQDGGKTWVITLTDTPDWVAKYSNVRVFRQPENLSQQINLPELWQTLAQENIGELMIEAGATLSSAAIAADCVDEIVLYQSPKILGETGKNAFRLPENAAILAREADWRTVSLQTLGDDMKWVLQKNVS